MKRHTEEEARRFFFFFKFYKNKIKQGKKSWTENSQKEEEYELLMNLFLLKLKEG